MAGRGTINIDTSTPKDGRFKSTISEIVEAREEVANQNTVLNQAAYDTRDALKNTLQTEDINAVNQIIKQLKDSIESFSKSQSQEDKQRAERLKTLLKLINAEKELESIQEDSIKARKDLDKAIKKHSAKYEDLAKSIDVGIAALDKFDNLKGTLTEIIAHMADLDDSIKAEITERYKMSKLETQTNQQIRKKNIDEGAQRNKKANEDLNAHVKSEIKDLGNNIRDLLNTVNISRLANSLAPSSRQLLQGNLQTTYNLSGSEFESFKKDLYNQINNGNYTNEDILKAMETLNTTELGSTKTATKYFADIIKGQKVLGISSQTQQNLLKLGNVTGRNELVFYQNQVAKYLNSSLGLNKQRLDELGNLNSNVQMQAADIGIATEAFETMSMNEAAAFEKTNIGAGAKYTQALSNVLANTEVSSAMLGLRSGDLADRLAAGESFTDILRTQMRNGASAALNTLRYGNAGQQTELYEYARSAWGIDANTWSVLRIIAQQETELNKNLKTATDAANTDGAEALKSLEQRQYDSLNAIQQTVNSIHNFLNANIPWQILQEVMSIGTLLATLISTVQIAGNISEITKGLGGVPKASLFGKAGTSMKAFGAKVGGLSTAAKFGSAGLLAIGAGIGIHDAGQMSRGAGLDMGDLRGFFMGTGHSEQSTMDKVSSIGGNGLKGLAIGAGIGTLLGGPLLGTAIGGAIGLGLGALGTLLKGNEKSQAQRDEETNKALAEIKENTYTTAMNTSTSGIGMVYRYRGTSNYSTMPSGIGGPSSYNISSYYGPREPFKTDNGNITSDFHSGIDYAAPEGTPLYSNVSGTVLAAGKDNAGANYVGVTDNSGYTHWYWHMQKPATVSAGSRISQGTLVGYVGKTGNVKGAHLHYMVTKPNTGAAGWANKSNTVNPLSFATSSIFSGIASPAAYDNGTDMTSQGLTTIKASKLSINHIGGIAAPIVDSISDLKQTIIDLSDRTSRNEKIMNMLVNRTMESPTV